MLDLEPRVHLEEIEASVLPGDELDGAGGIVLHRLRERDRLFAHPLARFSIEQRRGRLLDHLLVATLNRAFALAEMDHVPVLVAEHLNLDMARIDDEFLDEHPIVAERGLRFGSRSGEAFEHVLAGMRDAHAFSPAAGGSLDHDRIANLVGDLGRPFRRFDHAEIAGNGRNLGGAGEFLRFDLVAHRLDGSGIGADEDDSRLGERMREGRALREKAVAWVDGLGAGLEASGDDLVDCEIGLGRRRRPDGDGLVRHLDVQRFLVGFGIDGDRPDAHAARRLDDATGDLAAVGDQDCLEHRALARKTLSFPSKAVSIGRTKARKQPPASRSRLRLRATHSSAERE